MFSLFFNLSRPVSAWNEAWMMFFNFLNYFAIFFGILSLGSGKNGSKREKFFLSFLAGPDPFRLEIKLGWCFFNFFNFLLFFWEFSRSDREKIVPNWKKKKKKKKSLFQRIPTRFCLKWSQHDVFFYFLFFYYFLGILKLESRKNGSEPEKSFLLFFGLSRPVLTANEARMMFFNLLNISSTFLAYRLGRVKTVSNEKNFFSLFQPVPTRFGFKWS